MKNLNFTVFVLLTVLSTGCTTLADARRGEGTGAAKIYQANFDQTWSAAVAAVNKLKLDIASEVKTTGTILVQRGMTLFSYGENVAVFVKPKSATETSVEVVSKKAMATNIFAPDWSEDIHKEIGVALKN